MKKVLLIYLFIISGFYGYTQDTIYIGEFGSKVVTSKSEAKYYQIITKDNNDKNIYFKNTYYLNDTLFRVNKYFHYYDKKRELLEFKTYYRSGNQHIISSFENGKVNGDFISFWENGKTKRINTYKKGKLIEGHCWDEMGKEVPYYKFEIDAQFSGGMRLW